MTVCIILWSFCFFWFVGSFIFWARYATLNIAPPSWELKVEIFCEYNFLKKLLLDPAIALLPAIYTYCKFGNGSPLGGISIILWYGTVAYLTYKRINSKKQVRGQKKADWILSSPLFKSIPKNKLCLSILEALLSLKNPTVNRV